MDSLEEIYDEIKYFANLENIEIINSEILLRGEEARFRVIPIIGEDWKNFIKTAKNNKSNFIIIYKGKLEEEDFEQIELSEDLPENNSEIRKKFSKFLNKIGELELSWINEGIFFSMEIITDWYNDFLTYEPIDSNKEEEDVLKKYSIEDLTKEMIEFIKKEYGNIKDDDISIAIRDFWLRKNLKINYETDPKLTIKIERVRENVFNFFYNERNEEEKNLLPNLLKDCLEWARKEELKKINMSNLNAFLSERGISLNKTNFDILYNKINLELKKK